jgi:hypothetical protein
MAFKPLPDALGLRAAFVAEIALGSAVVQLEFRRIKGAWGQRVAYRDHYAALAQQVHRRRFVTIWFLRGRCDRTGQERGQYATSLHADELSTTHSGSRILLMTKQAAAISKIAPLSNSNTMGLVSLPCKMMRRLSAVMAMKSGKVMRLRILL